MCGIAGLIGAAQDKEGVVARMVGSMHSRGPDATGAFHDGNAALGHCRLKIIDLSDAAAQPMPNEDRRVWVVFNGEIYNFVALRQELVQRGHRFVSACDTEVIVHGYEEWGPACVERFSGMFACAIWDCDKKQLLLARDRLGIKPLYYYSKAGIFLFASQLRALLASGIPEKRTNLQALSSYLSWGGVQDPSTMVEGVQALMPGTYLLYRDGDFAVQRYWDMSVLSDRSYQPALGIAQCVSELRTILTRAVQGHLVSDVPLGVFLSGGIDSSSLVSFARQAPGRVVTVSLAFNDPTLDERRYAQSVAAHFGTEHREVVIEASQMAMEMDKAIEAMDQPTFDGINTYFVSKAAREAGLTVALSGLGADEVFGGYPTFRRAQQLQGFLSLWQLMPRTARGAFAPVVARFFPEVQQEKMRSLLQRERTFAQVYAWMRALFTDEQKQALCNQASGGTLPPPLLRAGSTGVCADAINEISRLELSHYCADVLLRDTDCMSMSHSLEVRVPFLDPSVVEYMLSVPGNLKMNRTVNKPLLIASLPEPLPHETVARPKKGFALPFASWMQYELRDEMKGEFSRTDPLCGGLITRSAAEDIWKQFLAGNTYWQRPWALYVLSRWCERYMR